MYARQRCKKEKIYLPLKQFYVLAIQNIIYYFYSMLSFCRNPSVYQYILKITSRAGLSTPIVGLLCRIHIPAQTVTFIFSQMSSEMHASICFALNYELINGKNWLSRLVGNPSRRTIIEFIKIGSGESKSNPYTATRYCNYISRPKIVSL